jgi:hypothetical protein
MAEHVLLFFGQKSVVTFGESAQIGPKMPYKFKSPERSYQQTRKSKVKVKQSRDIQHSYGEGLESSLADGLVEMRGDFAVGQTWEKTQMMT